MGFTQGVGASDDYRLEWGAEITASGDIVDGVDDETLTFTQPAPDVGDELFLSDWQPIPAASVTGKSHINLMFRRLGSDGLDTRGSGFRCLHLLVEWQRADFRITT